MFDQVVVSDNPKGKHLPGETETRLHVDSLHRVSEVIHHPTKLSAVALLSCSCGYEGIVPMLKDEDGEVATGQCPNCKSNTVHPDDVEEVPTTHIRFSDGSKHTMTRETSKGSEVEQTAGAKPPVDFEKMVDDKLNMFMSALSAKLGLDKKPKEEEKEGKAN